MPIVLAIEFFNNCISTGVGSGFTLKMRTLLFSLVTLYTSTRQERENRAAGEGRLKNNRLLAKPQVEPNEDGEVEVEYEVRQAVKDLCQTLDGFIFVVDVTKDSQTGSYTLLVLSLQVHLLSQIIFQWNHRLCSLYLLLMLFVMICSSELSARTEGHVE